MKNIQTAMGNIWTKQLEKNPKLANLPMVKAMMNLSARGKGPLSPGVAQAIQSGEQTNMPRTGMMGGRRMAEEIARRAGVVPTMKKGGKVKKMAKGGSTASKRGDGIATKGKTKGRFV